jgi:hypothetical protein
MSIESYLGDGDRATALQELKLLLAREVYINCILCNIEPSDFDYIDYLENLENNTSLRMGPHWSALSSACQKLKVVEEKIATI